LKSPSYTKSVSWQHYLIWYTCRIILKEAQIFLFLLRK
ncbi:transposase, partial [Escherichia coli]